MKILTALDRSEYAEIVLEHGLDQAVRHTGAQLHFVTVVDDAREMDAARSWLDRLIADGLEAFDITRQSVMLHVRHGRPGPEIAALAAELSADLLVIGRFHVPSESDTVVDSTDCPTLVVGVEGHVLEPQCRACRIARRESTGERLFCELHAGDRMPELVTRLPPSTNLASRLW
jgi:nucleotide-binding universal stress UspA family protein